MAGCDVIKKEHKCMFTGELQKYVSALCGGCHQWGNSPNMENGKCSACKRTESQIIERHGKAFLTEREGRIIKNFNDYKITKAGVKPRITRRGKQWMCFSSWPALMSVANSPADAFNGWVGLLPSDCNL
jgi:hypothetical protein